MTIGVLGVSSAVTGMLPQIVPEEKDIPLAETQALPSQYNIVVLADASDVVKQTSAVPAVRPVMERS